MMSAVSRHQNKMHSIHIFFILHTSQVIAIMVTAPETAREAAMLVMHSVSAVLHCSTMPRVAAAFETFFTTVVGQRGCVQGRNIGIHAGEAISLESSAIG